MSEMQIFFQTFLNNLYYVGVLALTTMGLTLTYKTANVTNFSQAIVSTFGAFTGAFLIMKVIDDAWITLVIGVAACFIIGVIIDAVIIRRASPTGTGRVMITLGLIVLFNAFLPLIFGMIPYEYTRFFNGNLEFHLLGETFTIAKNGLFIFLFSAIVVIALFLALNFSKWGLGVRATASNKAVADIMGINTNRMTAMSWAISSACGGLAALFYASQTTNVSVGMLATVQSHSLLALVLGGFATFYGPLIGALIIPILTVLISMYTSVWSQPFMYIVALIIVLILPNGLFGKQAAKKV